MPRKVKKWKISFELEDKGDRMPVGKWYHNEETLKDRIEYCLEKMNTFSTKFKNLKAKRIK